MLTITIYKNIIISMKKNLIALAAKTTELAHKLIILKLEENEIKGMVPSHGSILHLLYAKNRVTMKEISEFIHKTKPTVTVLVDKLINLDYVCKEKCEKDSRITYITLTSKGKSFESIFKQVSDEVNQIIYQNLTKEESQEIEVILSKVINSLKA